MLIVKLSSHVLVTLLTQNAEVSSHRICEGLPAGAQLVGSRYHEHTGLLELFFEHPHYMFARHEVCIRVEKIDLGTPQ